MPHGRTPFEQIALLLQGGGALGAYQAGVYEALAEADLHPDWVAGISTRRHQFGDHCRQSAEAPRRCAARILADGLYFATRRALFPGPRVPTTFSVNCSIKRGP